PYIYHRASSLYSRSRANPRVNEIRNRSLQGPVLSANLPNGFRRRRLRTEQRILRPNELATRNLVLRRPSEPAHFHGRSAPGKSAARQVATSTGFDFVPANHSTRVRRRIRRANRLREIPSGPGSPGGYRQGLAGIRSPVRHALQGRHDNISRSAGWSTVPLFR